MPDESLYVYGIVKSEPNLKYMGIGLNGNHVYTLNGGEFTAIVHSCEEKPYISGDPNKIKELIITHNMILNKAMEDFDGVIPLPFNTIIKKGEHSSEHNLKKWLNDDKERLGTIWDKIRSKREYGIRIYYKKDESIQQASKSAEIKKIKESMEGKSKGLSYLLKGKVDSKINELVQNRISQFKQEFCNSIKEVTGDTKCNIPRVSINEKSDLLLSLSVLVDRQQIEKVDGVLEKTDKDFSFQLAGPFAPYSFVEK